MSEIDGGILMNGVQFKELLQVIRERWPMWSVSTTCIKDLSSALKGEALQDAHEAVFMVRKKYSSDVPRLPWFYQALDQIKGERRAEREKAEEQERLRVELLEREMEEASCNREHEERLVWLRKQSDKDMSQALQHCASRGYIKPVAEGDFNNWSRFTVGMVYAYMNQ